MSNSKTKQEAKPVLIGGDCDPAFRDVREAFAENLALRDEVGGAVCILLNGRIVVDLWGGHTDQSRTTPWQPNTLVNAYSVGKGITAILLLGQIERGILDLDSPVSEVWPEFAAGGKDGVTLRHLLAHRGGLPGVRRALHAEAMFSWETMSAALAEQEPYWSPNTDHGYHVNTFGFLVGEPLVRKVGQPFSQILQERLARPLQADFHIGLPVSEHPRVASIVEPERAPITDAKAGVKSHMGTGDAETDEMLAGVYFNPVGLSGFGVVNTPDWRSCSIPSTNSHATARSVATIYDAFMRLPPSQGGIVGETLREEATSTQSEGIDRVLGKPSRFGLGFQLSQETRPLGATGAGYGHYGYGGTLGFADPESGLCFAYLMNRPGQRWQTPRTNALVEAAYAALGASPKISS
ncbi:MAG: serine hydrolase domain-containing protein [Myxococcota bacterium]